MIFVMNPILSAVEARVLGSLIEKELTTPEYYPLSLNALVNACNQKSNRDPFMTVDEAAVTQALKRLDKEGLAGPADTMGGRVTKYGHRLQEAYNFTRHEIAIICELLLRGPQTPGELRSRAERMQAFEDLGVVNSTLQRLMKREPPLATLLPRQPGTKEARYAHLLSEDAETWTPTPKTEPDAPPVMGGDRIASLEDQVAELQREVMDLKQQFAAFRKQFE